MWGEVKLEIMFLIKTGKKISCDDLLGCTVVWWSAK